MSRTTTKAKTPRALRPRRTDQIGVVPASWTDRTAPAVVGLEPDVARAAVVRLGVPHTIIGHRMIVATADWLDAIARAATAEGDATVTRADDAPATADDLLARIGRRRAC